VQMISFRALVDNYGAMVLGTAVRILGDSERAQDVHQEVFLAIWQRWHKFNGQTNWGAYLYRATVRKAIDFAKRSRKTPQVERSQTDLVSMEEPDVPLLRAELREKLVRCLGKLPKRQAEVFVLSRIECLEGEKIAEILGCSHQTVRVHLHRAMKRLAGELEDYLS